MTNVRHSGSWQPPLLASFNVTGKREKARLEKTKWKVNEALSFVPFRLERIKFDFIFFYSLSNAVMKFKRHFYGWSKERYAGR